MRPLKVRTVSLLLLLTLAFCFATGAYQIYRIWSDHHGPHGQVAPPLGLPEIDNPSQHKIKLGT